MKQYYEAPSQTYLMRRTPVIIRLDGVAFHTLTRHMDKPFDRYFNNVMTAVTQYLVDTIQGCIMGYTQSDEISLLLQDYKKHDTDAWFGYNVQKLTSVSAAMATARFNIFMDSIWANLGDDKEEQDSFSVRYLNTVGLFDSRCFNIPFEEVNNYFIDRQQDAERNSVNLLAQQYYSDEELQGIKKNDLQNKLFTEKGINWNDLDSIQKRGYVAVPQRFENYLADVPIFSKDPAFVNSRVRVMEER